MPTYSLRNRFTRTAAVVLAAGLGVGSLLAAVGTAHADPRQFTSPLVLVGSDTIQEIDGALGGENNNTDYTPLHSDAASGRLQMVNWSATGGSCITPKAPGATIIRPNGSGAGRKALSRAIDGTNWGTAGDACGGPKPTSGLVDGARSSSLGSTAGTALTYIPFSRDGISYAGYAVGGATAVTSLTRAQITSIYTAADGNGTVIGGTRVVPCGIQTNSGTFSFWQTVNTSTGTQENTATGVCNSVGTGSRLEEHDSAGLVAKGNAINGNASACPSGCMVIVGHSASTWIAQQNGVAPSHIGTGAFIGSISDDGAGNNLGSPVSGSAPNMTASSSFYGNAVFGRLVYHVFDTNRVTGLGNQGLKQLFVGSSAIICQSAAQTTVNKYGLLSIPGSGAGTCGDISVQRGLDSGSS